MKSATSRTRLARSCLLQSEGPRAAATTILSAAYAALPPTPAFGVFTYLYRTATRSLALCKPTNCAVPHGSSEDRVLYARLLLACLTKYEQGSSRCSRFNRAAGLRVCGEACSKADWIRISVETQALTAGKWILNRQLINHLPLLQIFRVENGTSGTHCRSDDQAVID